MPTLDWLHRAHSFTTAAQVPYRLLDNVSTHGDPQHAAGNLLVQGDNLEALKALLPFYRGKVKCIFIDPPYNTQSAFEHYDDNLEHSQWLSMMLPRLQLLRDLLRDDGSIWVTIDDHEGHYLKVLMDEVFGRRNFVANGLWQKRTSPDARIQMGAAHDHILVYAKAASRTTFNVLQLTETQASNFKNPDGDPCGPWASTDFTAQGWRPNQMYEITTPGGTVYTPPPGRCWGNIEPAFKRLIAEGRIWFGRDGNSRPRVKNYLSDSAGVSSWTWWSNGEVGHNQESKKEINELFGADNSFDTPKPERLLQRILHIASNPNDLVLDSFLGSGTTAAVAHKMGRRWIGIEMGEHAATHCLPRLQKVIAGEQGGISAAVGWQGGGGFRFARLGAPIFDADGCIHPDVRFATLAAFIWQQETGTAWDPAHGTPGTPHLGTHSVFDSYQRLSGGRLEPISLEMAADAGAGAHIPSPAQGTLGWGAADASAVPHAGPHPSPPPEGEGAMPSPRARSDGEGALPSPRAPLDGDDALQPSTPVLRSRTAYYLLFNGILGDKRPASGNVLTSAVLDDLLALHASTPHPEAPLVVYGEACRLGEARLALARVTFKHIPYDVKAR